MAHWRIVAAAGLMALPGGSAQADDHAEQKVLAVFAHPDDELIAAPALARAAREGAEITLVLATSGDQGPGVSDLEKGDALAMHREGEALCSAEALGISKTIFLRHGDGTLGFPARHPRTTFGAFQADLSEILDNGRFDFVVTWGPDGGYGHSDHRMVSAITTQLVQAMQDDRPTLLYPAIRKGTRPPMPEWGEWAETDSALIDLTYRYEEQDLEAATRATACHESQFDEATRAGLMALFHQYTWQGANYFRTAVAGASETAASATN